MPLSRVCCAHFYLGSTASSWEFPVGKDGLVTGSCIHPPACARKVRASVCQRVQARAMAPTGGTEKPVWQAGRALRSPLPKFQAQLASVPFTKPSRISPDPVGSLVSLPGPRAVLPQIFLSMHDLLHVAGPLQSPRPPSMKLKCTCSRKPFLDPLRPTQLMPATSQERALSPALLGSRV